jgi:CheY-like chemotaxis protein
LIELKHNPLTKNIPVVIVSIVDDRPKGFALGAADYLVKPINRIQLQKSLNGIMGISEKALATALVIANHQKIKAPLIVLAEDNEANIITMLSYLEAYGLRIAIARNGLEAVHLIKQCQPDLVLMDIQMPEMDGLEAIRQVRSDKSFANLPIIAVTALAMPDDRDRCINAGANEYLTKPVRLKQVKQMIQQYLPNWVAK